MKKFFVAFAAALLSLSAFAQFGIVAGVTSSESTFKEAKATYEDITQYHVGVTYKIPVLGNAVALQPSLIYNVKGMSIGDAKEVANVEDYKADFNTGFLELPVQLQVGFSVNGIRPFAFVEPFVGYAITNESKKELDVLGEDIVSDHKTDWSNVKNRLEYGYGLGFGIELLGTLQVSARYFWNMGQLYEDDAAAVTDANAAVNTILSNTKEQKCNGIMASISILF